MKTIWVPDVVYKYLPLFCIVVGFIVAPVTHKLAWPLCVGLVAYGIAVYSMRRSWRENA